MHNTDDLDSAWDKLDSEFGLEPDPAEVKPQPQPRHQEKTPPPAVDETEPELHAGALFDPGPEQILEDTDHIDGGLTPEGDDEFDDTDSSELFDTEAAPAADTQEGGKRKRKRRRRKKKRGNGDPNAALGETVPSDVADVAEVGAVTEAVVPDDEIVVEEGEAPELVEDDDEAPPPSAVDEELVAEAVAAKQEWNVMSWGDLIGKLYRPS